MTELIQSLKAAVARYPGTMAELARRAAIARLGANSWSA